MMRRSRCANAVASAGTRAIAPPRTRSCATAIGAVEPSMRSTIVSAVAWSTLSANSVRDDRDGAVALVVGRKHLRIGHRADHVGDRGRERAERRHGALAGLDVARVDEHRHHDEPAVVLRRQERQRRRGHDVGDRRELLRRGLRRGDEGGDHVGRSPGGTASRRRPCRPRAGGTAAASRRRSCRRRRGSPRTGRGGSRRRRAASSPSAVTTSAASRLSIVRPCLRTRKPTPPPSVIPPIPTEPVSPNPVARPCAPAAAVYSPAVRPVSAQAVRPLGVDLERAHAPRGRARSRPR